MPVHRLLLIPPDQGAIPAWLEAGNPRLDSERETHSVICAQAAAMGAAEAKIAGAVKKNTGGSNKKKKGQKK